MSKIFGVLAVLLILTGVIVLAVPREAPPVAISATRGPAAAAPASQSVSQAVSMLSKARDLAEQVNAPLSILFGLISLFYSRRTYLAQGKRS